MGHGSWVIRQSVSSTSEGAVTYDEGDQRPLMHAGAYFDRCVCVFACTVAIGRRGVCLRLGVRVTLKWTAARQQWKQ